MSKMSCLQFLEKVSQLYPEIPVILSSVHSGSDIMAQVMDTGAAYFLPRPFKINQLQEAIYQAIQRHTNV
jgi:DNA-binding NtrC family response regulator